MVISRSGDAVDGWGAWGQWSQCSASCGGGQQFRTRQCERGDCDGPAKSARACNTHPCQDQWGCWTDWSPCSVSCGVGKRTRTRDCLSQGECEGDPVQFEVCEMPSCDSFLGWSTWSEWSGCNEDGERVRTRTCLLKNPSSRECQGEEREVKQCYAEHTDRTESASVALPSVLGTMVALEFVAILGLVWLLRKEKKKNRGNTNLFGLQKSAVPNQYSSVPTKEVSVRR